MHAIIGGTGFYEPELFSGSEEIERSTSFGKVSLISGMYKSERFFFLPRHGKAHTLPPSRINFRANITALKELGVKNIAATSAVGSMKKRFPPKSLLLATQFIDFTKSRHTSLYDEVVHTDFTTPYCPQMNAAIKKKARELGIKVLPSATYVCTEGPRFETPAEIQMYSKVADVVGMTGVPEVVMAREAHICYASLCIVTNWAAGLQKTLSHHECVEIMAEKRRHVLTLLLESLLSFPSERTCSC
jgi:5'-methylthioadenosine phosphorylase